jgi:hypothetical protein
MIVPTYDVFISHATIDDPVVSQIQKTLSDVGIKGWVDHEQGIIYGDNWDRAIHNAANDCKAGLFILSSHSANSEYCSAEWNRILALGKRLYIAMIEFVPVAEIPLRLGTIQYVDLTRNFGSGLTALVDAIQQQRALDPTSIMVEQVQTLTGPFPRWQLDLPIIGREGDLKTVQMFLTEPNRLVAILGLGGVGKTRLAAEIVSQADYLDGVIWHDMHDYPA